MGGMAFTPRTDWRDEQAGAPFTPVMAADLIRIEQGIADASTSAAESTEGLAATVKRGDLVVNVRDHGAAGDGATDDRAALQAVIDASEGKRVYFPPGTYMLSGHLTVGRNRSLVGAGVGATTVKLLSNADSDVLQLVDASSTLVTDLTLDGDRYKQHLDNTASSVIRIDTTPGNLLSSYYLTIDRVVVQNGAGNGVTCLGNNGSAGGWYNWVYQLSNVSVKSMGGYGLYDETSDNRYANWYFTECDKADMYLKGASTNLYQNFKVGEGGRVHQTTAPNKTDGACIILESSSRCLFSNIDVQSSFWDGIYAKDCRYITFNGVDVQNSGNWGYYFVNCKGFTGTATVSATSSFWNKAGDFYFDSASADNYLMSVSAEVSGAPALVVSDAGTNNTVRPPGSDIGSVSVTNVLANSNFTSASGWQASNKTAAGNIFTWRANFQLDQMLGYFPSLLGHKYYFRAQVQAASPNVALHAASLPSSTQGSNQKVLKSHTGAGGWEVLSGVASMTPPKADQSAFVIQDNSASGWADIKVRYAVVIDLTATFGQGREPSAAEMDALLATFPSAHFTGSAPIRNRRFSSEAGLAVQSSLNRRASAAPTAGVGNVGDIVWNSAPASGSPVGWVCTSAGMPGVWAGFGTLA